MWFDVGRYDVRIVILMRLCWGCCIVGLRWWVVWMDVKLPHVGPCLFPVSLEDDCPFFVDDFDIGGSECHFTSCVAEFAHAKQVVGK